MRSAAAEEGWTKESSLAVWDQCGRLAPHPNSLRYLRRPQEKQHSGVQPCSSALWQTTHTHTHPCVLSGRINRLSVGHLLPLFQEKPGAVLRN